MCVCVCVCVVRTQDLSLPQRPPLNPSLSLQHYAQAARVAELLQLKVIILLAYRERLEEAVAQANAHIQFFTRPPSESGTHTHTHTHTCTELCGV